MKKFLLVLFIVFSASKIFAQSFNQYNTGTLYDSFENPAQKSFTPDSSREFAFNLFVPNFDANFSITGNAQRTLKSRAFSNDYNNQYLVIGPANHFNRLLANADAYPIMFKFFSSLNGDVEIGFFVKTVAEARGTFTDESIAYFNGVGSFPGNSYTNIFNSNYRYQIYNEAGFSYREQVTKNFAIGFKLAYVAGYQSGVVNINQSSINIDKEADTAVLALQGTNDKTRLNNAYPWLNPGVSFSVGTMLRTRDGFVLQANVKDLGFIHWNRFVSDYQFNTSGTITDLTSPFREEAAYDAFNNIATSNNTAFIKKTFNSPLDGRAEFSVSKMLWANDDYTVKYTPTLIASKELFYTGFIGALVNPISYNNYTLSLSTSYTDTKLFNLGLQFMYKTPNVDFFIGTERLTNTATLTEAMLKSHTAINSNSAYTGADISLGFSLKFGAVVEHPMNASVIPMDPDRGFIGRMWRKVFHPNEGTIQNN